MATYLLTGNFFVDDFRADKSSGIVCVEFILIKCNQCGGTGLQGGKDEYFIDQNDFDEMVCPKCWGKSKIWRSKIDPRYLSKKQEIGNITYKEWYERELVCQREFMDFNSVYMMETYWTMDWYDDDECAEIAHTSKWAEIRPDCTGTGLIYRATHGWDEKQPWWYSKYENRCCVGDDMTKKGEDDHIISREDIIEALTKARNSGSDLTHDQLWKAAGLGEEISVYDVVDAFTEPATDEDKLWAEQAIENYLGKKTRQ